jgi:hypothetical protein
MDDPMSFLTVRYGRRVSTSSLHEFSTRLRMGS